MRTQSWGRALALAVFACALVGTPSLAQAADFDNDGFDDLAAGVPGEEPTEPATRAGAVSVIYGGPPGLTSPGNQLWHQDSPGIPLGAENGDAFGTSLAAGDFDNDGFDDLAIGVPGETIDDAFICGVVHVLYGSIAGLTPNRNEVFSQDAPGVADISEDQDQFGTSLAAANLGRGGSADLAIGSLETVGAHDRAGAVHVLYGAAGEGLTGSGAQYFHQNTNGIANEADQVDFFGSSIAAANLGNGATADLAIGVPLDDVGANGSAGLVHVLYATPTGLTTTDSQLWHQNSPGIDEVAEGGDEFGSALSAGDLGRDGTADLAVAAEREDIDGMQEAGAVQVIFGSAAGLAANGDQLFHQNTAGIADASEVNEFFGFSLAIVSLGNGATADLAIGVPFESLGAGCCQGAVHVLYGSATGPSATGSQYLHQNSAGVLDTAEGGDDFGWAFAGANFGNSAHGDLAVGVPREDVGAIQDAGAVNVLYGSPTGVTATGDQVFNQDSPGIIDSPGQNQEFGFSFAQ